MGHHSDTINMVTYDQTHKHTTQTNNEHTTKKKSDKREKSKRLTRTPALWAETPGREGAL